MCDRKREGMEAVGDRAETRLGIHDTSRMEWVAELPLPASGEEEVELEVAAEIPEHIWLEHDHWEHLQLLARLSSPCEQLGVGEANPGTVDELRHATLAAVHRIKEARRAARAAVRAAASPVEPNDEAAQAVRTVVESALGELSVARAHLATEQPGEREEVRRERELAAEFLSNHALDFLSSVQRAVDDRLARPSRAGSAWSETAAALQPWLAELLGRELAFRATRGLLRPDVDDPWQLERFVARASLLKKHFQELLFLDLDTERSDKRFRNWFGVVAASLAALWAFPLGFLLTGVGGTTGLGLGLSTTIALLVLSYAVKDRIKESVRSWLSARVSHDYAGRLTTLTAPARLLESPLKLARVREWFFTTREVRPDPLVPDLGPTRPVVRLRYQLRATVEGDPRLAWHGHERMKLVFRYDFSPLFHRLDDPIKRVPVLGEGGRTLRFAEAARCYRVPVRLTLRHRDVVQEQSGVLLVHKLGLERLERPVAAADNDPLREGPAPLASIPWMTLRRQ